MQRKAYAVLAVLMIGSALAALYLSWTALGHQFDTYAYDFLFRLELPAPGAETMAMVATGTAENSMATSLSWKCRIRRLATEKKP